MKPVWAICIFISILVSVAVLSACGSGASAHHLLFAVSHGSNQVAALDIAGSGVLNSTGTPADTGPSPVALAVLPSRKFAYAADFSSNDVATISVAGTGKLTSTTTKTATGAGPVAMAIARGGSWPMLPSA